MKKTLVLLFLLASSIVIQAQQCEYANYKFYALYDGNGNVMTPANKQEGLSLQILNSFGQTVMTGSESYYIGPNYCTMPLTPYGSVLQYLGQSRDGHVFGYGNILIVSIKGDVAKVEKKANAFGNNMTQIAEYHMYNSSNGFPR